MTSETTACASNVDSAFDPEAKVRRAAHGDEPEILTDIYLEEINMAIWERQLPAPLQNAVDDFIKLQPTFRAAMTVTPQNVFSSLSECLSISSQSELSKNIAELVIMFCCLFDLKRAGLRLAVLDRAMCPRFHVDNVPCRLVTTYQGVASQWLAHQDVNRAKLGAGSEGLADLESGLFKNNHDIQQLACGDVALLKGELWEGNENAGLVHRSPAIVDGESRLILTMDFSS